MGQRIRLSDSITDSMNMNLSKLWEIMKDREAWHAAVYGVTKSRIQLNKNDNNIIIMIPTYRIILGIK